MTDRRTPLVLSAGIAAAVVALAALAVDTVPDLWRGDTVAMDGFTMLRGTAMARVDGVFTHAVDPAPFLVWLLLLVGAGVVKGRRRAAAGAGVATLGAALTAQVLKALLPAHISIFSAALTTMRSFPSGHTTGAVSLVLGAMLVVSPRVRARVAIIGGAAALGVSFALLLRAAHYPSDVIGGTLIAFVWMAAAALWAGDEPRSDTLAHCDPSRTQWRSLSWLASLAVGGASVVILLEPDGEPVGAILIAALAIGLSQAATIAGLQAVLVRDQAT